MTLPLFWRRASFAVAEAAELIGVPEITLRTWMARTPFNDFLGLRQHGRIWLSGQDVFFFLLVRDLVAFGVPVRTAMFAARGYANDVEDSLKDELLVVRTSGGKTTFELTFEPSFDDGAAAVIPLYQLATGLIDRAAAMYVESA